MPPQTAQVPGNGTGTLTYTIPGDGLDVESVYAIVDATGAGGVVTAELTITDQSGVVIARKPQVSTVTAGVTGSATWGLRLDDPSAAGAAAAGALTLITKTVLSANGNFSFTPIAGTFNDLIIVGVVRSTAVGNLDNVRMQFNGDTAANYAQQYERGNAAGVTAAGSDPVNQVDVAFCPGAGASANRYAGFEIWIPGYADSTHSRDKVGYALNGFARGSAVAQPDVFATSYAWVSTAAITRVDIFALAAGGFLSGSECRLYGRL